MTVLLTLFGLIVFVFSCFTVGFKAGFKRLMAFAVTGLILDVLIGTTAALFVYGYGF
jgi:hypothetical protein